MTLRRNVSTPLSPEWVAEQLPPEVLDYWPPEDYRAYFRALSEEVELITGQDDSTTVMEVAEILGVSVVDWFKVKLSNLT